MKVDLLEILACPMCKASLKLETTSEDGLDVIEGLLICDSCPEKYPIEEKDLYIFSSFFRSFLRRYKL